MKSAVSYTMSRLHDVYDTEKFKVVCLAAMLNILDLITTKCSLIFNMIAKCWHFSNIEENKWGSYYILNRTIPSPNFSTSRILGFFNQVKQMEDNLTVKIL